MAKEASRPILISLIAILYFLSGLLLLAAGVMLAIGAAVIDLSDLDLGLTGVVGGAVFAVIGIIALIIAGGLWNGWRIMWYLGMIFSVVAILASIIALLTTGGFSIGTLVINLIIVFYLTRDGVKEFFGI